MRVLLMHPERDFDAQASFRANSDALTQDLALEALITVMAAGDPVLSRVARVALLDSLTDLPAIRFRQGVLADCMQLPEVARQLYSLASTAVQGEKRIWGFSTKAPALILYRALEVMTHFLQSLRALRDLADQHADGPSSEGLRRFFDAIRGELGDDYLLACAQQLEELRFRRGVLISAGLRSGNKGDGYTLRVQAPERRSWPARLIPGRGPGMTFEIPERDESGAQALGDLRARGIDSAARTLAQSAANTLSFFRQLQAEAGFYVACLNLKGTLEAHDAPLCIPECHTLNDEVLKAEALYDPCLHLLRKEGAVGNDVDVAGALMVVITGANQGGKSTFLRSVGLAYLMAQAGMFVAARSLSVAIRTQIFTHFRREEDEDMESGKLDEELARMSAIADQVTPGAVLLCNESFASTNEVEGSEIARHVFGALVGARVQVFLVTHLFRLASLYRSEPSILFLRAERLEDGTLTFRVLPGDPLPTSYGRDLLPLLSGDSDLSRPDQPR
ncbi:MAG: MutS-related protein [Candidatus Dormibacteria bacterium]